MSPKLLQIILDIFYIIINAQLHYEHFPIAFSTKCRPRRVAHYLYGNDKYVAV